MVSKTIFKNWEYKKHPVNNTVKILYIKPLN